MKHALKTKLPMALAAAVTAATFTLAPMAEAKPRLTGEEKLAKELEGRVAGKPVDCIYLPTIRSTRIIDKTAIVYDAGRTIYVNRLRGGADQLDDRDIMVTQLYSSQLCSIDIVRLRDQTTFFMTGFVNLGDFVPYTKPKKES